MGEETAIASINPVRSRTTTTANESDVMMPSGLERSKDYLLAEVSFNQVKSKGNGE